MELKVRRRGRDLIWHELGIFSVITKNHDNSEGYSRCTSADSNLASPDSKSETLLLAVVYEPEAHGVQNNGFECCVVNDKEQ
jgi:hypothetical protein